MIFREQDEGDEQTELSAGDAVTNGDGSAIGVVIGRLDTSVAGGDANLMVDAVRDGAHLGPEIWAASAARPLADPEARAALLELGLLTETF